MEEYAYREAVGEEIESPARRVEYCLEWLREEFPESTADVLRGPARSFPSRRRTSSAAPTN